MLKRMAALLLAMTLGAAPPAMAQINADGQAEPASPADANVVKILRTTNKAQVSTYVPVAFTMTQNNPFNVIRQLRRPIEQEAGLLYTFVNPDGNGGKVVYAAPDHMIPYLAELVRSVDVPGMTTSAADSDLYVQLRHRRADWSDPGFIETAASFNTGFGTFITDPENNALFLYDTPSGTDALKSALDQWLDVPTAMVQLLVKVYEVDSYNDAEIGLDYIAWKNSIGQDLFTLGAYSEYGSVGRATNPSGSPLGTGALGLPGQRFSASGYNYAYRYEVTSAFFDYLQAKGKARMLNQAKLAALNTYPATLSAGNQILYYAVNTDGSSERTVTGETTYISNEENILPLETGLVLSFVPTIGTETVTLDIELDWSDYTGFATSGFPQISQRSLSTRMRLGVGEETVIGGLRRQVQVQSVDKVPILGSLPVIGYLFGGESTQTKSTEMIVAIQPIGIMDYDITANTMVTDACDISLIDQASGLAEIELPATDFGFDMWGLDNGIGVEPRPIIK